jgi:type VI secretion system secreted protein VgrG
VRVQMLWQQDTNQKSDWIRVMTPDAGGTGEVSKNRGHVFVPEQGDQVLIGFRYSDPSRPFVLGSLFHGGTAAGGKDKNSIKSIQTRSGHTLEFNDTDGGESITIKDKNGNMIFLDTAGKNLSITAPETMTFNAKNMIMKVSENMTINVGKDIKTDVDGEMQTTVAKNHTLRITEKHQITSRETKETVEEKKAVDIQGALTLKATEIEMSSTQSDILIKSAGEATLHGKSEAKVTKG